MGFGSGGVNPGGWGSRSHPTPYVQRPTEVLYSFLFEFDFTNEYYVFYRVPLGYVVLVIVTNSLRLIRSQGYHYRNEISKSGYCDWKRFN